MVSCLLRGASGLSNIQVPLVLRVQSEAGVALGRRGSTKQTPAVNIPEFRLLSCALSHRHWERGFRRAGAAGHVLTWILVRRSCGAGWASREAGPHRAAGPELGV